MRTLLGAAFVVSAWGYVVNWLLTEGPFNPIESDVRTIHNVDGWVQVKNEKWLDAELNGTGIRIDDELICGLRARDSYTSLALIDTDVTDTGLACLAEFGNLHHLSLDGSVGISVDGIITHLGNLPDLKSLSVKGFPITDKGSQRLREAFPLTTIEM